MLKNLAALMVVISCGIAYSAPMVQCRRVLMNEEMVASATVADFARMKLDLDLEKIRGKNSGPNIDMSAPLALAFDRKIQEFVKSSQGRVSESGLREMIREKIRSLQGSSEGAKESVQRKSEKNVLKLNRLAFTFKDRIERPEFATVMPGTFAEYVSEAKSFFWLAPNKDSNGDAILGFSLKRFDFETQTVETERTDITAMTLLEDPSLALLMTRSGETEIVDLRTMIVQHTVTTKLQDRVLNYATEIKNKAAVIAVNAGETVLAVSEGWRVFFFDVKSGDYLGAFEDHSGFNSHVVNIHFLNEHEVIFNSAGSLVKMNVVTQEKTVKKIFKGTAVGGLELSEDRRIISMMDLNSVVTINSASLETVNTETIFSTNTITRSFKRVQGSADKIIHIASRVGVYPQTEMSIPSFDFGRYPIRSFPGDDVLAISIPLDRSHAIVVGTDKRKPFLDIWNYSE